MIIRRRSLTLASAAIVMFSAAVFAQTTPQPRKLTDAEKKEIQAVQKVVDDAAAGQSAPNEVGLAWIHEDLLKAQGNKQYLPFSVSIDPSKISGNKLTFYWRVVSTEAPAAAANAKDAKDAKDAKKDDKKGGRPEYAYEDLNTIPLQSGQTGPMRISRSFTVAPGNYDVFIVAKETAPEKAPKNAPPQKLGLIKQTVNVPNLWNDELNTSSVIVAERIDPLAAPLTPQQQGERPYALGTMEIVPASSNKFSKKAELSTFLLIYNTKMDPANKPDVTVEYNFYAKQGGSEKFFNKTNPQTLNAQTLPKEWDAASGHQLQSGQAVPLASFPEGDYRLEIKVTDKIANKTLTRDVNFTVTGS
jgi:hypothetical protein